MNTTKPRYEHFDIFKGVAIFLVLCGHILYFGLRGSLDVILGKTSMIHLIISLHMPMFVFASGYFATKELDYSPKGVLTYWRDKGLRLLLPLLGFPLIYIFISGDGAISLYDLAKYWFTPALFVIFIPFYLVRLTSNWLNLQRKGDTIAMLVSVAGVYGITNLAKDIILPNLMYLLVNNVQWLYLYLVLGYILARNIRIDVWVRKQAVVAVSFILFLAGHIYSLRTGLSAILSTGHFLAVIISVTGIILMYHVGLSLSTHTHTHTHAALVGLLMV